MCTIRSQVEPGRLDPMDYDVGVLPRAHVR